MKHIFLKTALAALLIGGVATSCINDLNISSIDPQSSSSYEDMELLAKVYSTLGLTGQKGPAGSGDISSDEGESGFYRTTFNLQELCTDECLWAWQTDTDIPQITNIDWTASSPRVQWTFQRLAFDVTLCNFYLTNTEDKADDPITNFIVLRFVSCVLFICGISLTFGAKLLSRLHTTFTSCR